MDKNRTLSEWVIFNPIRVSGLGVYTTDYHFAHFKDNLIGNISEG